VRRGRAAAELEVALGRTDIVFWNRGARGIVGWECGGCRVSLSVGMGFERTRLYLEANTRRCF
jgi:hypothetical protein